MRRLVRYQETCGRHQLRTVPQQRYHWHTSTAKGRAHVLYPSCKAKLNASMCDSSSPESSTSRFAGEIQVAQPLPALYTYAKIIRKFSGPPKPAALPLRCHTHIDTHQAAALRNYFIVAARRRPRKTSRGNSILGCEDAPDSP